jgi:NADH:ubiquinone oxidoreductase subunit 2 (subunit N)
VLPGIATALPSGEGRSLGLIFGIFMLAGVAFKISAVPFHMWTPDVYEGAPTPVTAFFARRPKVAAMALMVPRHHLAFPPIVLQTGSRSSSSSRSPRWRSAPSPRSARRTSSA